jgi:MoaA/NifB/PqqE/SkfB family radical SAM enzyme/alpha-beta hydrolase superfamily lysophospholipase
MKVGAVLVHGYLGGPEHLAPLAAALAADLGAEAVTWVCLHDARVDGPPPFDEEAFLARIDAAVAPYRDAGRRLVLIGHSLGGCLLLRFILTRQLAPALTVLAAAPRQLDASYRPRWEQHAGGRALPLADLARLIATVRRAGEAATEPAYPVLAIHGTDDELVPTTSLDDWRRGRFAGPVRTALIPGGRHDLFRGPGGETAVEVVRQGVADLLAPEAGDRESALARLREVEPEIVPFLSGWPGAGRHVAGCPSARKVLGRSACLGPVAATAPVFANIEVTTHCAMACPACARTLRNVAGRHMPREQFGWILGLLPAAYRVTLVGLGEPLLHPEIVNLIAEASARRRRVSLVTNAAHLDPPLGRALLEAGLDGITFSLDAADSALAERIRPGAELGRVLANIRAFAQAAKQWAERGGKAVARAVFTAVSVVNAEHLEALVEVVAGLGVHVLMLSDLNFAENRPVTLWTAGIEPHRQAVRRAARRAFARNLPVLGVRGLEEFGLRLRYADSLLRPISQLWQRSERRTHCVSPWQTIPVAVNGEVSVCDCQPEFRLGNLLTEPLSRIWNGRAMVEFRGRMLGGDPPDACRLCPRF